MVQPLVQPGELPVDSRGHALAVGNIDAALAQRPGHQVDGLGETIPVRQALHLQRGRGRAVQHGGGQLLQHTVVLVRLLQPPQAEQRGVMDGVQLDEGIGVGPVGQRERGRQQRVHQREFADLRHLVGGASQQPGHRTALAGVGDRVRHRQVLLRRDREKVRHRRAWMPRLAPAKRPAAPRGRGQSDSRFPPRHSR